MAFVLFLQIFVCFFIPLFCVQPIDNMDLALSSKVQYGILDQEQLQEEFRKFIKFDPRQENLIGYLKLEKDSSINEATFLYVQQALKRFVKSKVIFIVFHIDSIGGDVYPTLKIADLLQKVDINKGIPTIAFIDNYALSAAAMIPYACRFIAISKNAYMGGHFPSKERSIFLSTSDSIRSMLKEEFSGLANFYGRSPILAEAMVDPSMVIVSRKGNILALNNDTEINAIGDEKDHVITSDRYTLTLDSDQLLKWGIADFAVDVNPLWHVPKTKTWLFEKSPLYAEPFFYQLGHALVLNYQSWIVSLYKIFTYPFIASFLLVLLIISFYIQLHMKRFNISGIIGAICLAAILTISYTIRSFSFIETIILILGVLLFLVEIFIIPGFGAIGILGIVLMIVGLFSLLLPGIEKFSLFDFESFSLAANSLLLRLIFLVFSLVLSLVIIFFIRRFFSQKLRSISKLIIPKAQQMAEVDFLEEFTEELLPKVDALGEAHCTLRPFGKVVVDGKLYDAISYQKKEIYKHHKVVVVDHENGKIVVKDIEKESNSLEKKH